jgi:membrane protein required for colicin V production
VHWLDISILGLAVVAAVAGWRTGLVATVTSTIGLAGAILLASHFYGDVAPYVEKVLGRENDANLLAFLLVIVVVLMVTAIASYMLRKQLSNLALGWVDKVGGLILGTLISLALLSAVLSMVDAFPVAGLDETVAESRIGSFLVEDFDLVLKATRLLPEELGTRFTQL